MQNYLLPVFPKWLYSLSVPRLFEMRKSLRIGIKTILKMWLHSKIWSTPYYQLLPLVSMPQRLRRFLNPLPLDTRGNEWLEKDSVNSLSLLFHTTFLFTELPACLEHCFSIYAKFKVFEEKINEIRLQTGRKLCREFGLLVGWFSLKEICSWDLHNTSCNENSGKI